MRTAFIFIIFLFLTSTSFGQFPKKATRKMGKNPVLFVDSIEVDTSQFKSLNAFDISNISVIKPEKAKKLLGDKGAEGAIYITTIKSAKQTYWTFLSTKSEEYKHLVTSPAADTTVRYILNGELLSDSAAPAALFLISNKNFKSLEIIDREDGRFMMDRIYPKRYIVVITANRPKKLLKQKNLK